MNPRLKSSKKWTTLPGDVTSQIKKVFEQNFQKEFGKSKVIVEGQLYEKEIVLRVGYNEPGQLTQNNFEVSVDYATDTENAALNAIHLCVDVIASLLTEHFESDGELEIPKTWTEFPFEEEKVWLQFSTENSDLEKQANELLGEWDDSLVQESDDADEADMGEDDDGDDSDDEGSGSGSRGPLH